MYVCTCNGVNERQVEAAIEAGAASPKAVHRQCGTEIQCGRCLPQIAARICAARASKSEAFAKACSLLTGAGEAGEVEALV